MAIQWKCKQSPVWQSGDGIKVRLDQGTVLDWPQVLVTPGNGAPSYTSDNHSVAEIDPNTGEIQLQGLPGAATITARLGNGEAASYTLDVQEIEAVISFPDYPSSSASVSVNNSLDIRPIAKTKISGSIVAGATFTCTSSKSSVTVTNAGLVTAGANVDTATITVTLNSDQYTAGQATFLVKVLASADDVVVTATSDASVLTVTGGAKQTCQITPTMTINGKKQNSVTYEYSSSNTDIATVGDSGQVTSKTTPGVVGVTVTATVTLNGTPVSATTSVAITVVAVDGDTNNPRPVSYPSYSGTEIPSIDAVKALLQALMYDDPNTHTDDIDQPASVAAQLFGLDYSYFAAIAPSGKKVVFPIKETNDIYQASCKAISHLQLKVSKELVLGDNISFSCTRGNTFSINVNLNNKVDRTGQDLNHDGIDDSVKTGHGVTNTSITGITSELKLGVNEGITEDFYSYSGSPGTGKNHVYLPRLKTLKLDYGNITSYRADRVITMEFMGPESDGGHLDASRCSYASFQLVTKELFHPDTGSNTLTGTGESPNIGVSKGAGQDTKGKSSYDSGIIIAPDEKNLGLLLQDYFQDGYMAQYDSIGLPREFLADSAIDVPGVNILQFTRGKSRLIYEYLDGMIKQYWLANKLVATTIIAAVRVAVAMVFIHKLDYFQVQYNNHNNAAITLNTRLQPLEANFEVRGAHLGINILGIDNQEFMGNRLLAFWGSTVRIRSGAELKAAILECKTRLSNNETIGNALKAAAIKTQVVNQLAATQSQVDKILGLVKNHDALANIHVNELTIMA